MNLALAWMVAIAAEARPLVRFDGASPLAGSVGVATGFDSAVLPLTVEGAVAARTGPRTVVAWAGATAPLLGPDLHDHRLELGAAVPLLGGGWDVPVSVALREVSTRNDAFGATAVGTAVGAAAGRFAERWTLAAEAELWTAWATHLRTMDFAERYGGVDPWSGWTARTAASVRLGVQAAGQVGPVEIGARVGFESRGRLNLVVPPLYATAQVGYRF